MSGVEDLKQYSIFESLSELERAAVADLLEPMDLDPGEQLFLEGQESEGLVLVESGALALQSARMGELGELPAGSCLGAVGLVVPGRREVTAVASAETRVWLLSRESFQRLAIDDPAATARVLEAVIVDLASLTRMALDRLGGPAGEA